MRQIIKITTVLASALVLFNACSTNDIEPTLAQEKDVDGSIVNVSNLYSILKGAHDILTDDELYGRDIIATNEVRSDNCFSNGNSGRFSTQAEYKYNDNTGFIWEDAYEVIANANIIIATDITTLEGDQNYGKHIQGQAYALRALAHYDLLRHYGQQHSTAGNLGVPYVKTFKGEDLFPARNTVDENRTDIYADLETAYSMMTSSFDTSKTLISKYAAKAIESRVAIYFGDWGRAKDASEIVIGSTSYSIATAASFVSNWATTEAPNSIFELAFAGDDSRGGNSLAYIYRFPTDEPGGYGDVEVVSGLDDLFEGTDVRGDILGYQHEGTKLRNMGKYPDTATGTDNIPVLRYEEVILNYAEALFELGDADALTQLNLITSNRGATAYATISKDNILNERRKELMFEGFRFDDLMRTGKSIDVLGSSQNLVQTLSYPADLFVYPIPASEVNANSNMVQNKGY